MKKIINFIKEKIKNRPKKPKWEVIYDTVAIIITILLSAYLITKDVSTQNMIRGLLNKSNIQYSDVSCGGLFATDCEIENVSLLNGAIKSKTVLWTDVLGISKENGTSKTEITASDISVTKNLANALSSYSIFKIIGAAELEKSLNDSELKFSSTFEWNNSKLVGMKDLTLDLKSNLSDVTIKTTMKNMDKDAIVSDTFLTINVDKIVKTLYNRYLTEIKTSGNIEAINVMYFNKSNKSKIEYKEFKSLIFGTIKEASSSEAEFYKDSEGFYREYYNTISDLSTKNVNFIELSVKNKQNLPASILQSGYVNPYDTNVLDVKIKTYWL